ncbi:GNAT family N-acetyltransferase [Streptomyces griseoruber]|uniref:Acetyltransferase n=1 Tax=Streptomyces griseoruber TaxID=1943 RepID=A0A101SLK8_9ACTN|nr:GNAT family N-acetyltransferase [Streptomyces griseoruber]KUN76404.1 acetyltransferase [Streptomyces griseoruber]
MTDQHEVAIVRRAGQDLSPDDGLSGLLAAYHLRTQDEKGEGVERVEELPERYREEVRDPRGAFGKDVVLLAVSGGTAVGCLVVTGPVAGRCEVKRLWTQPALRGRGVASALIGAALAQAGESGVSAVRLSVWQWRTGAIALYERLGFTVVESWDGRERLVCMERAL